MASTSNLGASVAVRVPEPLPDSLWLTCPVLFDLYSRHLPFSNKSGPSFSLFLNLVYAQFFSERMSVLHI